MKDCREVWAPPELLELTRAGVVLWREVAGTDGYYEVSNLGRMRSWVRATRDGRKRSAEPKVLSPSLNRENGYRCVTIFYADGRRRYVSVSVLVCEAFIGPRPGLPTEWYAGHDDDDRTSDRLDNLKWQTPTASLVDQNRNGVAGRRLRECREADGVKAYRCTRCGNWKPESDFGRLGKPLAARSRCKFQSECRACSSARRNEDRRQAKAVT